MTKPVLFISHSSGGYDQQHRVVKIRTALFDRLSRDWDVFLDLDRIRGGDRWRLKILDHIHRAQAAIVLFDLHASTRHWVSAETLMFCFRKSLASSFQFVPVLFDGLKLSDTDFDRYEPFGLNEVQAIPDHGQSVDDLVNEIVSRFQLSAAQATPSSRWVQHLLTVLESVSTHGWAQAAEALEIECAALESARPETHRYLSQSTGQLMHHRTWQEILMAVETLLHYLALKPSSEEDSNAQQQKLCRLIRTKWVPNESVEVLLCASRRRADLSVLAINAEEARLVEQYAARIKSEFRGSLHVISVPAAIGEDDESRLQVIRSAIVATLFSRGRLPRDDSGATKALEDAVSSFLEDDRIFAVLALPHQFATSVVIDKLRDSFPRIVLLVIVPMGVTNLPFQARWLSPRVTFKMINDFERLDKLLESACGDLGARDGQ